MSCRAIAIAAAVWPSSCAQRPAPPPPLAIEIGVETDSEIPLEDVPVYVGRTRVGEANAGSTVRTVVSEPPGTKLRVWCECPTGFQPRAPSSTVVVRRYRSSASVPEMTIMLRCRPELRVAAFVVWATGGSDVDVFLGGTHVATTDSNGVAHFWTSAAPGSEHHVELRASRDHRLRPQRASHFFELRDRDSVFFVSQAFERETPAKRRRNRHRIIKIE